MLPTQVGLGSSPQKGSSPPNTPLVSRYASPIPGMQAPCLQELAATGKAAPLKALLKSASSHHWLPSRDLLSSPKPYSDPVRTGPLADSGGHQL